MLSRFVFESQESRKEQTIQKTMAERRDPSQDHHARDNVVGQNAVQPDSFLSGENVRALFSSNSHGAFQW